MKKNLFFILLICISNAGYSQKLHAFLFCKTNDPKIGTGVKVNFANMKETSQLIATALNYTYVEHSVTGVYFNESNIQSALDNVKFDSQDIVIMYFSTHGAKSPYDSNIFPQLSIPNETGKLVSGYKMHQALLIQKPKFLLTIIEACSGFLKIPPQQSFLFETQQGIATQEKLTINQINKIKKLFITQKECDIIISAGQPGKNTYATDFGSMFTICFLNAFGSYINSGQTTKNDWDILLEQAKQYTYDMTSKYPIQYYPVWEKRFCTNETTRDVDDRSIKGKELTFNISCNKTQIKSNKQRYDVKLTIDGDDNHSLIEKTVYYLDRTMEQPTIEKADASNNYLCEINVWKEYPIKAKVYLKDGRIVDIYNKIVFTSCP